MSFESLLTGKSDHGQKEKSVHEHKEKKPLETRKKPLRKETTVKKKPKKCLKIKKNVHEQKKSDHGQKKSDHGQLVKPDPIRIPLGAGTVMTLIDQWEQSHQRAVKKLKNKKYSSTEVAFLINLRKAKNAIEEQIKNK